MSAQIGVIEEVEGSQVPLEYLEREICQLASNIAAATCRWLLLLAEFDRRRGWAVWGARSCTQWLSWRCGIGEVAARDHLRVAQRLAELEVVRAAFGAGELSYSKVRAISRVATAETEATLVELARHATASHMEQIARAYREVKRRIRKDKNGNDTDDDCYLHWYWDDDGYLVIAGRFPPEEGAVFIEALNAARAAQADDAEKDQPADRDSAESGRPSSGPDDSAESARPSSHPLDPAEARTVSFAPDDSAESRLDTPQDDSAESHRSSEAADSATAMHPDDSAESCLETPQDDSAESLWVDDDDYLHGYWMVPDDESGELVWVTGEVPEEHDSAESPPEAADGDPDEPTAAGPADDSAESRRVTAADALMSMAETMLRHGPQARDGGERYQAVVIVDEKVLSHDGVGRSEIDNGPAISPEVARRITCDSSVVMAILGAGGEPLNVGRTTRSIPTAIRRALRIRDGKCRFPGCTQRRFVDGHHIQHWSQGGETSLQNLVLLCRLHHRKIHEENFSVRYDGGTRFSFTRPDGTPIPESPPAIPALKGHVVGANQELGLRIGPDTGSSLWAGEQLDLAMVIDGLFALEGSNLN